MATDKIQVRGDSYAASAKTPGSAVSFTFMPQVRTADQGVGMVDLVLEQGQSGDTEGGGDTFNMTHAMPSGSSEGC